MTTRTIARILDVPNFGNYVIKQNTAGTAGFKIPEPSSPIPISIGRRFDGYLGAFYGY